MRMKNEKKAFLSSGWKEVRGNIPKGKFRLVFLDFWDHTAEVIGDYDSIEEAKDEIMPVDDYEDFVIYNDSGEVVYDVGNFPSAEEEQDSIDLVLGGEEVSVTIEKDDNFAIIAVFLDSDGNFEDLLYDTAKELKEAREIAKMYEEKYDDYEKIIIVDRNGKIVEEATRGG